MTSTIVESVNSEICDKLANISFKEYQRVMKESTSLTHKADKYIGQWTMVQRYCRKMRENNYSLKIAYKIAGGRIVGKGGIQGINKLVRGALCDGRYLDFDMVNCHPVLLVHICKTKNIPCRHLEKYMSHREDHLKSLTDDLNCSRDEAKQMYIASANYDKAWTSWSPEGGGRARKIKCKMFLAFDEAMKGIQQILVPMYREAIKGKFTPKTQNIVGSAMSYIMCDMESKVLTEALATVGAIPNVRMYDGFMIDSSTKVTVEALDSATEKYNIKWSIKDHNTAIVESLAQLSYLPGSSVSLLSPDLLKMCNDLLTTLFKDRLCRNQGVLYFKTKRGWVAESKMIERELFRELSDCDLWLGNFNEDDDEVRCVSNSNQNLKNLIEFVVNRAIDDPLFLDKIYDWTMGKIYFQNGYWDFPKKCFVKTDDMHTFVVIARDFSEDRDPALRRDLYRRVFDPIFNAAESSGGTEVRLRDRFLHKWSRIMAGHVEDKNWLVLTGQRNCGKGVLIDLTIGTFGNYIGSTNAENFAIKRTDGDSQKALSFLIPYQWKRLMACSEMEMTNLGLSGTLIKKVNSGGDTLSARSLYKDEIEFRVQSTLVIVCNDMNTVKPADTMEKMEMYSLSSKFVNANESTEYQNISYHKSDPTVKTHFIQDFKVRNEFFHMMIDAYSTPCVFPPEIHIEVNQFTDDLATLVKRIFIIGPMAIEESGEPSAMSLSEFKRTCASIHGYSTKKLQDACIGLGADKPVSPFHGPGWRAKARGLRYIRQRVGDEIE